MSLARMNHVDVRSSDGIEHIMYRVDSSLGEREIVVHRIDVLVLTTEASLHIDRGKRRLASVERWFGCPAERVAFLSLNTHQLAFQWAV